MTGAEDEMRRSLHAITKEGVFKYASQPRLTWVEEQLGMVAVAGSQIWWCVDLYLSYVSLQPALRAPVFHLCRTWETEDVFRRVRKGDKYAMKAYAEKVRITCVIPFSFGCTLSYLPQLTKQLLDLVAKVRENIPKMVRIKVNTLLIVDVHARDIVDSFVRDSILDAREFAWESQLRFYWDRDADDIIIRQCTGNFRYGFEYMGLNGRLVITPLTDRCD